MGLKQITQSTWNNVVSGLSRRYSSVKRFREKHIIWKNVGFVSIMIFSSPIWFPRTMYQLGIMISDNIREYYTDKSKK